MLHDYVAKPLTIKEARKAIVRGEVTTLEEFERRWPSRSRD